MKVRVKNPCNVCDRSWPGYAVTGQRAHDKGFESGKVDFTSIA